MEEKLKMALLEAAKWEEQLTEFEKTKISFGEARQCVVNRIFEKYKKEKPNKKINSVLAVFLFIIYTLFSSSFLMAAMLLPFYIGNKDFPTWLYYVVYPVTIVIVSTQKQVYLYLIDSF